MRGLGSIPTRGNILSLDFISHSKASDANIGIIADFVFFVKKPKYQGVKEFHMLARIGCYCNIMVFSPLKLR